MDHHHLRVGVALPSASELAHSSLSDHQSMWHESDHSLTQGAAVSQPEHSVATTSLLSNPLTCALLCSAAPGYSKTQGLLQPVSPCFLRKLVPQSTFLAIQLDSGGVQRAGKTLPFKVKFKVPGRDQA